MTRQTLEKSIIVSAWGQGASEEVTLVGHELGDESLAFRSFTAMTKGALFRLQLSFWDRTVTKQGKLTEFRAFNGGWEGVMKFVERQSA